jgi:hypothetical protein
MWWSWCSGGRSAGWVQERLQDIALALLPLHGWLESRDDSFVKDILQLRVASVNYNVSLPFSIMIFDNVHRAE